MLPLGCEAPPLAAAAQPSGSKLPRHTHGMCTFVQNCLEDKCRFTPYDAPRPLGSGACCGARIALFEPGGHPQNSCNTGPNRSAANAACGSGLACDGGLPADAYPPGTPQSNVGAGLPAMAASQPTPIHLAPHNPMWELACLRWRPPSRRLSTWHPTIQCGSWLACDGGLPADAYPPGNPQSNCGSGLAREGGLAVSTVGLCTYPLLR